MTTDQKLEFIYKLLMDTADAGFLNARGVRTGYTHWLGPELKNEIRTFTGLVSESAIQSVIENGTIKGLVLEHFRRLQTELTALFFRHMDKGRNVDEFIGAIRNLEVVNIVTKTENDKLRRTDVDGDYHAAGILLVEWENISIANRQVLYKKIRGQVANACSFILPA